MLSLPPPVAHCSALEGLVISSSRLVSTRRVAVAVDGTQHSICGAPMEAALGRVVTMRKIC